jgi:hypothetical protein
MGRCPRSSRLTTSGHSQSGQGPVIPTGSYVTAVLSRDVRDLADLGSASRSLGAHWEAVGGDHVSALAGTELRSPTGDTYRCTAVQRLDTVEGLLAEASGRGLKSPDCLFAGADRFGRLVIQPGDFKFTLDVATRDQIDPAPMRALFDRGGPRLQQSLAALLDCTGGLAANEHPGRDFLAAVEAGRARLLPGLFLAPDEPTNRLYLRRLAHRRRNAVTEADVHFLPVDLTFFDGLPGAEVAPVLMAVDGIDGSRLDFPAATYYFQLGAAVRGAFALLLRPLLPLLGPDPAIDAAARLREHLTQRPPAWAIDVAHDLAVPAAQRRERMRLAQRLAGTGLRGRMTGEVIASLGLALADEPGAGTVARSELRPMHEAIDAAHLALMQARAVTWLAEHPNPSDEAVLAWLRDLRPEVEQWARAMLADLLRERAAVR